MFMMIMTTTMMMMMMLMRILIRNRDSYQSFYVKLPLTITGMYMLLPS